MAKKRRNRSVHRDLEDLNLNEREKIYKRARQRRRAERAPKQRAPRIQDPDAWDDDDPPPRVERMKSRVGSLDDFVEEILAEEELVAEVASTEPQAADAADVQTIGVVIHLDAGRGDVWLQDEDRVVPCVLTPDLAERQGATIAVGDDVLVSRLDSGDPPRIEFVLPRRSKLSRPDATGHGERVIVANVDTVVIVAAAKEPPLRPRLIDRYLIAIARGDAAAFLCINKVDLLTESREHAELESVCRPYPRPRSPGRPLLRR